MMLNLNHLIKEGFLTSTFIDNEEIIHIKSPCLIKVNSDIVNVLKKKYISTEELGGVLIAEPKMINNERVFEIIDVEFIRNTIDDKPKADNRTKANSYLPDYLQLNNTLKNVFTENYLPIQFHTHPTGGKEYFHPTINQDIQTNTSEADRKASEQPYQYENKKLLMPEALIVGNDISSQIFIGFYNGFIAPYGFEESKEKIEKQKMEKVVNSLSDNQKIVLGIGAALLFITIVKYPKYSLPVLFSLGVVVSAQMTNTQFIERPEYFNKLSFGDALIYIP